MSEMTVEQALEQLDDCCDAGHCSCPSCEALAYLRERLASIPAIDSGIANGACQAIRQMRELLDEMDKELEGR